MKTKNKLLPYYKSNIMRFTKTIIPGMIFIATLFCNSAIAQDAVNANKNVTSANNQLSTLMVIISLLLAFVIWGMGQVLVTIGRQALEKSKNSGKTLPVILLLFFTLSSLIGYAQDSNVAETVNVVPNYGGMDSTAFWILAFVIFIEVIVIFFMMFSIRRIQTELLPQKEKMKTDAFKDWWSRMDKKLFTKAVSVEREADILLDHDYDGIKELDNSLPPWWKYGFYITIVVAFIYLMNFHVLGYGQNPTEEYQEEMIKAQETKEIYDAKNADKIDENNILMPTAEGLAAGKEIFVTACWACHGKLGEGGAGPNLTDDYWIHKGSLSDIYNIIKQGVPEKGMQSWEKNYSPKEINNIAGFIKTLRGSKPPNPKDAQGDLFVENIVTDSVIASKDPGDKNIQTDSAKTINK